MKKILLFIVVTFCCITLLNFKLIYASTDSTSSNYVGYSSHLTREQLKEQTNTIKFTQEEYDHNNFLYQSTGENVSTSNPLITVLTHGYGGYSEHWSNDFHLFSETDRKGSRYTNFCYDPDSIIEKLREVTNGEVYYADMLSQSSFDLYKLQLNKIDENDSMISLKDNYKLVLDSFKKNKQLSDDEFDSIQYSNTYEKVTELNDISKHIIIIFEAFMPYGLNDEIYEQLDFMLDKLVYDVKTLNGGLLPKVNLVSHSRGGITNMQYTLEHPDLVDSICTLGSPFLGSNLGKSEVILNFLGFTATDPTDGVYDITNEEKYNGYKNRWNKYYDELYSDINFHAIGGYSSIDFLNSMLLLDDYVSSYDMEWFLPLLTYINLNKASQGLLTSFGKISKYIPLFGTAEEYRYAVELIFENICFDNNMDVVNQRLTLKDDLFIHLDSQLAVGYEGVNQYAKKFKLHNTDLTKLSEADIAIVHNLEARDAELIDYIIKNMKYSSGIATQYITEEKADGTLKIKGTFNLGSENNEIIIPSEIGGKTVSEIAPYAFANLNVSNIINTIVIPSTIEKIGTYCFANCNFIQTVNFEQNSNLEVIDVGVFSNCINLSAINLPSSINKISTEAFTNCNSLSSIVLPTNLSILETDVFVNCFNLDTISISSLNNTFKVIDNVIYSKDETKLIYYPIGKDSNSYSISSLTQEVLTGAIVNNNYISYLNLSNVKILREYSIVNCSSLDDIVGTKIESVYEGALDQTLWLYNQSSNASLGTCLVRYNGSSSIVSKEELYNIKTIGSDAFYNSEISEIVIPENVEQINPYAFNFSSNLKKVIILGSPYIFNNSFNYLENEYNIYFKYDLYEEYCSNSVLSDYSQNFDIIATNLSFADNSYSNQIVYYGEEYSLPTSDLSDYTMNWYDQSGKYYSQTGVWKSIENSLVLTASIDENIKFVNENGDVLYQYNLLYGDNFYFDNKDIYINEILVYSINSNNNYYNYEYYINNEKVNSGVYDKSFVTVIVKEIPITFELKIYKYNPYHDDDQFTIILFTYEDIVETGIEYFYAGNYDEYIFKGLFKDSLKNNQLLDPFEILVMSDKVLYADWDIRMYEVIFKYNDDNNYVETMYVSALENIIIMPYPSSDIIKEHYYSVCWEVEINGEELEFETEYEIVSNSIISLKWELVQYNLVYKNLNGATNTNRLIYTFGMTFDFASPVLTGHTFRGWFLDTSFTLPITRINSTDFGDKTLYAKWEKTTSASIRTDEVIINDEGTFNQHYDIINITTLFGLSAQELYDKGYREILLSLNLKIWEVKDGYQHIYLYNGASTIAQQLYKIENIEHGGSSKETDKETYLFTNIVINIEHLLESNFICVRYDASGNFEDDWGNCELSVSMSTTQVCTDIHEYIYVATGSTRHRGSCACGEVVESPHVINASEASNRFARCIFCNYILDLNSDNNVINSINPGVQYTTENGSYILPNGIYVLVDNDIDAYINGTLVFGNNKNSELA